MKGSMDNLPFGEDGSMVGESEKYRFTNYERDNETASDYAVNRQYSQSTGRFNRPDPIGGSTSNPQSLNRYAYVLGGPTNSIDPLGLVVYYCPPQYSSCATLMLYINGIAFAVNVGFSGGRGTFLWNQLGVGDQMSIAQLTKESPLPEGFDIYFRSLQTLATETRGSTTDQARNMIFKKIQQEIDACTKTAASVLSGEMNSPFHVNPR